MAGNIDGKQFVKNMLSCAQKFSSIDETGVVGDLVDLYVDDPCEVATNKDYSQGRYAIVNIVLDKLQPIHKEVIMDLFYDGKDRSQIERKYAYLEGRVDSVLQRAFEEFSKAFSEAENRVIDLKSETPVKYGTLDF